MLQILFNYAVGIVLALVFWRLYRLGLGMDALHQDQVDNIEEIYKLIGEEEDYYPEPKEQATDSAVSNLSEILRKENERRL